MFDNSKYSGKFSGVSRAALNAVSEKGPPKTGIKGKSARPEKEDGRRSRRWLPAKKDGINIRVTERARRGFVMLAEAEGMTFGELLEALVKELLRTRHKIDFDTDPRLDRPSERQRTVPRDDDEETDE